MRYKNSWNGESAKKEVMIVDHNWMSSIADVLRGADDIRRRKKTDRNPKKKLNFKDRLWLSWKKFRQVNTTDFIFNILLQLSKANEDLTLPFVF